MTEDFLESDFLEGEGRTKARTGRQGDTGKVWRSKVKETAGRVTPPHLRNTFSPWETGTVGHSTMGDKRWQGEGVAQ